MERDTGVLEILKYNIQLEDGATLGMSARVSGYTEEVAHQLTKALNTMNSEPDEKEEKRYSISSHSNILLACL